MSQYHRNLLETVVEGLPNTPSFYKVIIERVLRQDLKEKDDAPQNREFTIRHIIEHQDREGSREAPEAGRRNCPVEGFTEGWQDPSWDAEGTRPIDVYHRACLDLAWSVFDKEPYSCSFHHVESSVTKAAILRVWAGVRQRQANDDDDDTPSCAGRSCADQGDRFQPSNDQARTAEILYRAMQRSRVTK